MTNIRKISHTLTCAILTPLSPLYTRRQKTVPLRGGASTPAAPV